MRTPDHASAPQAAQQLLSRLGLYMAHQKEYLHGMMGAIFARPLAPARAERYVSTAMQTSTTAGAAMLVADLLTVDRRPYLREMKRPALIISSATAQDIELQRAMLKELPSARMVEIADAGHAVFADQPEKFDAELIRFIEQLQPAG